jgi:hypothetical protein
VRNTAASEVDLKDELKKLGLRIRRRTVEPRPQKPAGQIAFDDRGNAVYSWNEELTEESLDGERARRQALDNPGLSMVDEDHAPNAPIRNNGKGMRVGYNPYESGLLGRKQTPKKRDLRELSKWLEMKRRLKDEADSG